MPLPIACSKGFSSLVRSGLFNLIDVGMGEMPLEKDAGCDGKKDHQIYSHVQVICYGGCRDKAATYVKGISNSSKVHASAYVRAGHHGSDSWKAIYKV